MSGTASRLVKDSAYHHFTLLLHTDLHDLTSAIKPHPSLTVSSATATASVRSDVTNICTLHPEITHEDVVEAVAHTFYDHHEMKDAKVRISNVRLDTQSVNIHLKSLAYSEI